MESDNMIFVFLFCLILMNVSSVIATAQVTPTCGNKVYPGQAQLLTCSIKGSIEHGINWYREKEGTTTATCGNAHVGDSNILRCEADRILNEIVWFRGNDIIVRCDTNGQCRPHSTTNYNGLDSQRMRINKVSEDDIKQKWTCLDGDVLHEAPDTSTCKMKRVYSTDITSNCGSDAEVGKPHVLTCSIVGRLVNGVTWFRGNKAVVRCNPDFNCFPESPDYRESVPYDKGSVKLFIVNLTEEDKQQIWTCIDDDKLPPYELPTEVQCKIDETSNISKASACLAVDMKSLVILFCAVTFITR